jgi:hypothetical protein
MKASDLMTVRNYANKIGKTSQWVYRLGEQKKIEIVEIDGVKFVNVGGKK